MEFYSICLQVTADRTGVVTTHTQMWHLGGLGATGPKCPSGSPPACVIALLSGIVFACRGSQGMAIGHSGRSFFPPTTLGSYIARCASAVCMAGWMFLPVGPACALHPLTCPEAHQVENLCGVPQCNECCICDGLALASAICACFAMDWHWMQHLPYLLGTPDVAHHLIL